jgi:acetyl esterase
MIKIPLPDQTSAGRSISRRAVWMFGLGLSLLATGSTVLLAVGTFFDPALNRYTMRSSLVWAAIGPHLVLLSLVALAFAFVGIRRGPRRMAEVVAAVAVIASIASTFITAQIVWAIHAAGGDANPISALFISSIAAARPDLRETYTTVEGQPLQASVYRPARANGAGVDSRAAPVVFYIHGGGWVSGNADMTATNLRWFADNGWLVVSIDYRLATAANPTWDKAPRDVACALSWTAQNAPRLGGDPGHIVVFGESAGGNLAINLSYGAATGQAESGCGGDLPVPVATVVQYPVVDPQNAYDHPFPYPASSAKASITTYIGGSPEELPDRMRAISSATYLSKNAPRTLIIEPELDGLIPPEGVYGFANRARAAGVDVTLIRIPFANHGFDMGGLVSFLPAANSIGNQSRSIIQHYLKQRRPVTTP